MAHRLRIQPHHLPLIGLLVIQLLSGVILTPMFNFGSIYLNESIGYTVQEISVVIAIGQIIGMVSSLLGGSLSDKYGHKWILFIGVSLLGSSAMLYLIHVPLLVIILWCTLNAGLGLSTVSGQGYLTLATTEQNIGVSSALYNWGYTIGGAISITIATAILGEDNYFNLGIALMGMGAIVASIATTLPVLRNDALNVTSAHKSVGYKVLYRREALILLALRFLPTTFYGVLSLLPLIIKQVSNDNTIVAFYITGSSIFASVTQIVAGRAADKFGIKLPAQLGFGAILLAIGGFVVFGDALWSLFVFGYIGLGAAWALATLLPSMVTHAIEPDIRGRVFGSLHLVWTIAMALGTLIGGNFIEINFAMPFLVVGALNLLALGLTVPFFQITTRKAHTV